MQPRNTLILALMVAALGAFVWLYEIRGGEQRAENEAAGKRVFQELEAASIDSLTVRTGDAQSARLERAESGWLLVEPVEFPADDPAAEGIASALAALDSEAVFSEPAPLEDYGLAGEPIVRFTVDGEERAIRIGDTSPVGGNTYVTDASGESVWAVSTWRTTALKKELKDLRDKRVLDFDRDTVDAIRVGWPGGAVRLARSDDRWRVLEPLETPADEQAIDDLLSDLSYLRASDFIDDPGDLEALGLTDPAFFVELSGLAAAEGGQPLRARLALGASLDEKERAALGGVDGVVYRIPSERLDDYERRVSAYRFRELASFASSDAERLEFVFHDEKTQQSALISGSRGEDGRWSTEPEAMDPSKAQALIGRLATLRAREIAAESMGPEELAALGLAPPRLLVRVHGAAGEDGENAQLAEVQIGVADPKRGVAARRGDGETVYWLDYDVAEQIPVGLEAFRNRFLAAEDEPAAAEAPAFEGLPPGFEGLPPELQGLVQPPSE